MQSKKMLVERRASSSTFVAGAATIGRVVGMRQWVQVPAHVSVQIQTPLLIATLMVCTASPIGCHYKRPTFRIKYVTLRHHHGQ